MKTININGTKIYYSRGDGRTTSMRHGGSFKEWPVEELMHDLAEARYQHRRLTDAIEDMSQMLKDAL